MLFDPVYLRNRLAFALQIITASERLLEEAAQECDGDLRMYFLEHLREEKNHAKWLAEDLDGFTLPLNPIAVALAGSQYYLIKHVHPACLLGYMRALENPMSMNALEELEGVHGKKLLRTLRIHAEEDPGHLSELIRQIGKQPTEVQALIAQSEEQTIRYINGYHEEQEFNHRAALAAAKEF